MHLLTDRRAWIIKHINDLLKFDYFYQCIDFPVVQNILLYLLNCVFCEIHNTLVLTLVDRFEA